jgi:hypothetical protein
MHVAGLAKSKQLLGGSWEVTHWHTDTLTHSLLTQLLSLRRGEDCWTQFHPWDSDFAFFHKCQVLIFFCVNKLQLFIREIN